MYGDKADQEYKCQYINQIEQYGRLVFICTNGPYQSDRMSQGDYLRDRPDKNREIFNGKDNAGKEKHRRDKAGEIEIKMIDRFDEGCHQQR